MSRRRIPVRARFRAVIDNDFAADPDGLVALAHHLLVDACEVRALTGTSIPFRQEEDPGTDPAARIARALCEHLGVAPPPISADAAARFDPAAAPTDGARLILAEAAADDDRPLFLVCGGPLTNIASALRADPALADRATVVWIGGGGYPDGGWEYNLQHDLAAARFVFNESRIPIVQVPQPTYRQCAMSVAELEAGLCVDAGDAGRWLYERFTTPPDWVQIVGVWPMGDSPPVLITTDSVESSESRSVPTPWITADGGYAAHPHPRPLTVYERIDVRLLFGDFFARMRLHAARAAATAR